MPTKTTFTFTEKPCLRALHFLKHISFNKFKTISAKKCKNEEDRFQCFNKMKHYVKTALDNRGLILCNYEYSPNTPKTLGGRLFSLNSIQLVACEIRGLLFKHATDIDISNCHPCLLLYLCKKIIFLVPIYKNMLKIATRFFHKSHQTEAKQNISFYVQSMTPIRAIKSTTTHSSEHLIMK